MDNNLYFSSVKPENAVAMKMTMTMTTYNCNTLKRIAKCFRTLEISLSIFFLIYLFTHLPLVLRLSGEYFRCLSSTLTSPLAVFLILNTLVLFLYKNYNNATTPATKQHDHHPRVAITTDDDGPELSYQPRPSLDGESVIHRCDPLPPPVVLRSLTELVVYQDKEVIVCEEKEMDDVTVVNREVRRSESQGQSTRRRRKKTEEMELSNEEFRRTIEEFLQKQKKFHQEEKLSSAADAVVSE